MSDLFKTVVVGDEEYSALRFGPDGYDIPYHLMHDVREDGLLITDDQILPFLWKGVSKDEEGQYILLEKACYEEIWTLKNKYRDKALNFVRKIAFGLYNAPKEFLDLETGIFPLYRIYIKDSKDIVLLPPDASAILSVSRTRDIRDKEIRYIVKPDAENGYTLYLEMAELLYYAASGIFPYENEEIRRTGFHAVSLNLYENSLDEKLATFITDTLNLSEGKQRKLCGNRDTKKNLGLFLDQTEGYTWNLPSLSAEEESEKRKKSESNPEFIEIYQKTLKKAKFNDFWRIKGTILIASVVIGFIVLYLLWNWVYQSFIKPPETRELSQTEIIEHVYEAQTELNANDINEGFKKDLTQYTEVTNLYVTKATREAYEGMNPFIDPKSWIESDYGAIPESSNVYGVILDSIEEIGENKYIAHSHWYTPYNMDENAEEDNSGITKCYIYLVDQEFDFEWSKRGWWLCTASPILKTELLEVREIETYPRAPMIGGAALN